jgi:hypothetical protein
LIAASFFRGASRLRRTLEQQKVFSAVNIVGLASGDAEDGIPVMRNRALDRLTPRRKGWQRRLGWKRKDQEMT